MAALIISISSAWISGLQLNAAQDQLRVAQEQLLASREEFRKSGPVLEYESALQFEFVDGRRAPQSQSDNEHPRILGRDFDTYDSIYIAVTLTNIGRGDATITDVDMMLRKQSDGEKVQPDAAEPLPRKRPSREADPEPLLPGAESKIRPAPDSDGEIEVVKPSVLNFKSSEYSPPPSSPAAPEVPVPASLCSNQGGSRVPCDDVLPYQLMPGQKYFIYFSMKEQKDRLSDLDPEEGIPVRVKAAGLDGEFRFRCGVGVDL